jgi:hypothetical protein
MEGDDGRFYASEAEWEWAYNEGCKAELRAILTAEMADPYDEEYEDQVHSVEYSSKHSDEEIPF